MKREEFELLIEVALTVLDMAPPEARRAIERRINKLAERGGDEQLLERTTSELGAPHNG